MLRQSATHHFLVCVGLLLVLLSLLTAPASSQLGGQGGQPREGRNTNAPRSKGRGGRKGGGSNSKGGGNNNNAGAGRGGGTGGAVLDKPVTLTANGHGFMYWVPNQAGLFSHFLQLKAIYEVSRKAQRVLVIVPTTSPHYGETEIDMCTIFQLPADIRCTSTQQVQTMGPDGKGLDCRTALPYNYDDTLVTEDFCYSGTIKFGASTKARSYVLRAVENDALPMLFNASYVAAIPQFEAAMGVASSSVSSGPGSSGSRAGDGGDSNSGSSGSSRSSISDNSAGVSSQVLMSTPPATAYTVAHWRRGDQLESRCVNHIDETVNCGSAQDLIDRVRNASTDKIVYVATNEKQGSQHMEILRTAGFKTFQDVASSMASGTLQQLDTFHMVVLEAMLMIRARTFLGWGVSEINDLVEYERRRLGRSFCLDQYAIHFDAQLTWCAVAEQGAKDKKKDNENSNSKGSREGVGVGPDAGANANLHKLEPGSPESAILSRGDLGVSRAEYRAARRADKRDSAAAQAKVNALLLGEAADGGSGSGGGAVPAKQQQPQQQLRQPQQHPLAPKSTNTIFSASNAIS